MKRQIKKYPNRRLYDTERSCYITFDDIKFLVLHNIPFQVIDAKSGEDLTNNTLLQIVMELEQKGAPVFTTAVLEQMIRFYGNDYQQMFSDFLEKSFSFFKNPSAVDFFQSFKDMQAEWKKFFQSK